MRHHKMAKVHLLCVENWVIYSKSCLLHLVFTSLLRYVSLSGNSREWKQTSSFCFYYLMKSRKIPAVLLYHCLLRDATDSRIQLKICENDIKPVVLNRIFRGNLILRLQPKNMQSTFHVKNMYIHFHGIMWVIATFYGWWHERLFIIS